MSKEDVDQPGGARASVGSWMSGTAQRGQWPGEQLGLPESGPGSLARLGRRIGALWIDWLVALAISAGFFSNEPMITLAIFALENVLLVSTVGFTIGHRIFGMRVVRLATGGYVGIPRGLARAVLLCLVIPAVVWDSDGRGLHDRLAGTVLIRI